MLLTWRDGIHVEVDVEVGVEVRVYCGQPTSWILVKVGS